MTNYTVTGADTPKFLVAYEVLTVTVTGAITGNLVGVVLSNEETMVNNAGTISAGFGSAISSTSGIYYNILNSGAIVGNQGISLTQNASRLTQATIVNSGSIVGTIYQAISIDSGGNSITNSGTISSNAEVAILIKDNYADSGFDFINTITNTGLISAYNIGGNPRAILTEGNGDHLANAGTIRGAIDLGAGNNSVNNTGWILGNVTLGAGNDKVVNHGTLDGNVTLGDGADLFDGRGGHLNGIIQGGLGDDVYIIDDASISIAEEQLAVANADRVESSVSFALPDYIENLTLTGIANLRGVGNNDRNVLTGNAGDSTLLGRTGDDLLLGAFGDDRLDGGFGNDNVYAGEGDDTALGAAGNDILVGLDGSDLLRGGDGNDQLQGYNDDDTLIGGDGVDILSGGTGLDVFVFSRGTEAPTNAPDRITDFALGLDLIDLGGFAGTLTFRGTGAFQAGGPQVRIVQASNTQVQIDLNGDSVGDMKIILTGNLALTASDFIL
jgi:serralysin